MVKQHKLKNHYPNLPSCLEPGAKSHPALKTHGCGINNCGVPAAAKAQAYSTQSRAKTATSPKVFSDRHEPRKAPGSPHFPRRCPGGEEHPRSAAPAPPPATNPGFFQKHPAAPVSLIPAGKSFSTIINPDTAEYSRGSGAGSRSPAGQQQLRSARAAPAAAAAGFMNEVFFVNGLGACGRAAP